MGMVPGGMREGMRASGVCTAIICLLPGFRDKSFGRSTFVDDLAEFNCNSLNSTFRTALARLHVSDTGSIWDFEIDVLSVY